MKAFQDGPAWDGRAEDWGDLPLPSSRTTLHVPSLRSRHTHLTRPLARSRPPVGLLSPAEYEVADAFMRAYGRLHQTVTSTDFRPHLLRTLHVGLDATMDLVDTHLDHAADTFHLALRTHIADTIYQGARQSVMATLPAARFQKAEGSSSRTRPRSRFPQLRRTLFQPRPHTMLPSTPRPPHLSSLGPVEHHLRAAQELSAHLVVSINARQRAGIKRVITQSISKGITVDATGKRIASMVGLFPRWQHAVDSLFARMIANGVPDLVAAQRAQDYSRELVGKRGFMIARTELVRALTGGRLVGYQDMADKGLLDAAQSIKEWHAAVGACDECDVLDDGDKPMRVVGLWTPFVTQYGPIQGPPLHPSCRCNVIVKPARINRHGTIKDLSDVELNHYAEPLWDKPADLTSAMASL